MKIKDMRSAELKANDKEKWKKKENGTQDCDGHGEKKKIPQSSAGCAL